MEPGEGVLRIRLGGGTCVRSKYCFLMLVLVFVLLGAGVCTATAQDGQDRVSFGNRIVVNEGETVGDVVCFLCSVESHGRIQGDVVTFLGNVKATSPIRGDVVSFAGNVVLEDEASIDGDLVIFGGDLRKNGSAHVGQDQVIFPVVIFLIPIAIIGAIIWAISAIFRRRTPTFYIPPVR